MAAVLYCNGTIICNFGEKSGSLLGKNPASMGGSLASTKKNLSLVLGPFLRADFAVFLLSCPVTAIIPIIVDKDFC